MLELRPRRLHHLGEHVGRVDPRHFQHGLTALGNGDRQQIVHQA